MIEKEASKGYSAKEKERLLTIEQLKPSQKLKETEMVPKILNVMSFQLISV